MQLIGKRPRALQIAAAMLAALAVALGLYARAQAEKVGALQTSISASYERAFYETAALLGNIEVNLEKAQLTGSPARRLALLGQISRDAASAQGFETDSVPSAALTVLAAIVAPERIHSPEPRLVTFGAPEPPSRRPEYSAATAVSLERRSVEVAAAETGPAKFGVPEPRCSSTPVVLPPIVIVPSVESSAPV